MITDYNADNAVQRDGVVDGLVSTTTIVVPFSAIFKGNIGAIEQAVRVDSQKGAVKNVKASVKSTVL